MMRSGTGTWCAGLINSIMKNSLLVILLLGTMQMAAQQINLSIDTIIKKDYSKSNRVKDSGLFIKGIYIGTRKVYDEKGRLNWIINYGNYNLPRTISTKTYFYDGPARMSEGDYVQTSVDFITKHGIWKWYWKNGAVMDSVIFRDDYKVLRARFSKSGKLQFIELYPEYAKDGDQVKVRGYNKDGSIKYNRVEIKGKNGY